MQIQIAEQWKEVNSAIGFQDFKKCDGVGLQTTDNFTFHQ